MRYFFLLLCMCSLMSFAPLAHKFYVSIAEVTHNTEAQTLEIAIKIFTDDLEDALEADISEKLWIGDPDRESVKTDSLLGNYLYEKMNFTVNDVLQKATFIGKELEADVTWCYLEIENITAIKSIEIENRLLTELFEEQKNLMHIYANDTEKSLLLQASKSTGELRY